MMICTPCREEDTEEIKSLFARTFGASEGEAEGEVIAGLVAELISGTDAADLKGFVARSDGRIVASIFFSRLCYDTPMQIFMLSPVAVLTAYQGKGIGQQLIRYGVGQLAAQGVQRVFTYGDPRFYSRVGFHPVSQAMAAAPFPLSQPHGWLCQALDGSSIDPLPGRGRCVKAFDNPAYW